MTEALPNPNSHIFLAVPRLMPLEGPLGTAWKFRVRYKLRGTRRTSMPRDCNRLLWRRHACLDLTHAFDTISRKRLFAAIDRQPLSEDLRILLKQWHAQTAYLINHHEIEDTVPTAKGIRQGCRAAPFLWALLTIDMLQELAQNTNEERVRHSLTLYADDVLMYQTISSRKELELFLHQAGLLFDLLEEAGLSLSAAKSVALLKIAGKAHDRAQSDFVNRRGAQWVRVHS